MCSPRALEIIVMRNKNVDGLLGRPTMFKGKQRLRELVRDPAAPAWSCPPSLPPKCVTPKEL